MGFPLPCGGAEKFPVGESVKCRLSLKPFGHFAIAANARFPPILWKNNVLLAQNWVS
jgi:hypothetical protein